MREETQDTENTAVVATVDQHDDMTQGVAARDGKEGEEGEAGGVPARQVQLSGAVVELMNALGFPSHMLASVLQGWSHLKGKELVARAASFMSNARASAHIVVDWANRGFGLLMELFRNSQQVSPDPVVVHAATQAPAKSSSPQGP